MNDQVAHKYVAAYGRAEIVECDYDRITDLTLPIMAKHMPVTAEGMRAKLEAEGRVVVVLRPEKIVTN